MLTTDVLTTAKRLTGWGRTAPTVAQVLSTRAAVTAGTGVTDEQPVPLLEHYQLVPWASAPLDDPANVTIRYRLIAR